RYAPMNIQRAAAMSGALLSGDRRACAGVESSARGDAAEASPVEQAGRRAVMQSGQQTHVLAFEVGGHPVAIRASEIAQIVPAATLCCDGADASVFRGVLNLRGVAIPVIDLMHVLGLGVTAVGIDSHILITRPAPASYGLLVDR